MSGLSVDKVCSQPGTRIGYVEYNFGPATYIRCLSTLTIDIKRTHNIHCTSAPTLTSSPPLTPPSHTHTLTLSHHMYYMSPFNFLYSARFSERLGPSLMPWDDLLLTVTAGAERRISTWTLDISEDSNMFRLNYPVVKTSL